MDTEPFKDNEILALHGAVQTALISYATPEWLRIAKSFVKDLQSIVEELSEGQSLGEAHPLSSAPPSLAPPRLMVTGLNSGPSSIVPLPITAPPPSRTPSSDARAPALTASDSGGSKPRRPVHSLPHGGGRSGCSRVVASSPEGSSISPAPSLAPAAASTAVAPSDMQESTASASSIRPPTPCLCCSRSRKGCRIPAGSISYQVDC